MDSFNADIENPKPAPKHTRAFAAFVDFICLLILGYLIGLISGQSYVGQNTIGFELTGMPAISCFICWLALISISEGIFGQTVGKRLLRIKVIKTDLTNINIGTSITRHLFDLVDCFLLIGFVVALTNKQNRRIGDLVANTYVIDKL